MACNSPRGPLSRASTGVGHADAAASAQQGRWLWFCCTGAVGTDVGDAVSLPLSDAAGDQGVPSLQGAIWGAFPLVLSAGAGGPASRVPSACCHASAMPCSDGGFI